MGRPAGKKPIGENPGDRKKASRYRRKIASGKPLGPEEAKWMAIYTARVVGVKPEIDDDKGADDSDESDESDPESDDGSDDRSPAATPPIVPALPPTDLVVAPIIAAPPIDDAPRVRAPKAPPPEAPPRLRDDDNDPPKAKKESKGSVRWQDKYQPKVQQEDGTTGNIDPRELVCVQLASLWIGLLVWAENGLAKINKTPQITHAQIEGPIVLTLDKLLPKEATLTIEAMAVGGTAVIAANRLWYYKSIAKAEADEQAAQSQKSTIEKMREKNEAEQAERIAKAKAEAAKSEAATQEAERLRLVREQNETDAKRQAAESWSRVETAPKPVGEIEPFEPATSLF